MKRRPLYIALTPGQRHEAILAEELIEHARGRAFIGDTGYYPSVPVVVRPPQLVLDSLTPCHQVDGPLACLFSVKIQRQPNQD